MATYYWAQGGTAANKEAATTGTHPGGCMSPATAASQSSGFSAGDSCLASDQGGTIRLTARMDVGSSGSSGSPITWGVKTGETPIIKGSVVLTSATYKWTASGSGTNEYYCELSGGGDPSLIDPGRGLVFIDGESTWQGRSEAGPILGFLVDHEHGYGDNDTLGYNTIYIRDDTGDPDTSGVVIEAAQVSCMYSYEKNWLVFDGLNFQHGHLGSYIGGLTIQGGTNVIIQNCEAHWCNGHGLAIKGSDHTIDNCVASWCSAHNIVGTGHEALGSNLTLSNNVSHHSRTMGYQSSTPYDGYGLKLLGVEDGVICGNESYANDLNGINLDGSPEDAAGCSRCEVYDNLVYENGDAGVLVEIFSSQNKIFRNLIYNNGSYDVTFGFDLSVVHGCNDNQIYNNVIYRTIERNNNNYLIYIAEYDSAVDCSGSKIYGNTLNGHGISVHLIRINNDTAPEDVEIKNNILVGSTGLCVNVSGASYTGLYIDHNCMRRSAADADVVAINYVSYTLAELAASAYGGSNNIGDDPSFTDADNQDYTLASDSPCLGVADATLGSPYNVGILPGATWPDSVTTGDRDDY